MSSASSPAEPAGAAVELRRVTLHYGGRRSSPCRPALDRLSLRIAPGERVAIVGPSGAGKSSIIALLNTSIAPTEGTVRLFGQDPAGLRVDALRAVRRRVGTVYQQLNLAGPLRVVHNVNAGRLGTWSTWRALASLMRPTEVDSAVAALDSLGIADKAWQRTDQLSGGERQRVALARLLVQGAELIVADEPILSLDPTRGRDVLATLCAIADDGTRSLVVSLHAFELAVEYFDRVIGLRNGTVLFDRPSADVSAHDAAALYRINVRSS